VDDAERQHSAWLRNPRRNAGNPSLSGKCPYALQ
jgi:hypothetical protein